MNREVVAVIPITRGQWMTITSVEWEGFYFEEFIIDWSLFKNCYGRLYVETMHADGLNPKRGGFLRLAYQQNPAEFIPIEGSDIETYQKVSTRWQLLESEWFKLPEEPGVSCVWVQGKALPERECCLALATLVIVK